MLSVTSQPIYVGDVKHGVESSPIDCTDPRRSDWRVKAPATLAFGNCSPWKKIVMSTRIYPVILSAVLTLINFPCVGMDAVRGGTLAQPLFPPDNWWNQDIRTWPTDANSGGYIAFINNGGTRRLHPDFGGNSGNGYETYGMPYAVVSGVGVADLRTVDFHYSDESDGVDHATDQSFPFYPIPPAAVGQPYWIEGGDPGSVDLRARADRHVLIVDRDRNLLYELYNVFYDAGKGQWYAGSGAFFDMNTNDRRPDGWTSADAAGLAILPGLVRYDEVYDPAATEILHAFRVTVRATNGYVYPASHRAGSTVGALPMGARLRLKSSIDVASRTADPNVQKIFRAMQTYGLIVADNGSDLYVTGTYDTRWNNDILNPAFGRLTANDFEVIQLGYKPTSGSAAALNTVAITPTTTVGGQSATGTVALTAAAPNGGVTVALDSANPAATVPSSVWIAAGTTSASFTIATKTVSVTTTGNISARFVGVSRSATITVKPAIQAALSGLMLNPSTVVGGNMSVGTIQLTAPAPPGGLSVKLGSNKPAKATVPPTIAIPQGASSVSFNVATSKVTGRTQVTISAVAGSKTKRAVLTITKR